MRRGVDIDEEEDPVNRFSVEDEAEFVERPRKERRTRPVLSKFERAKVIAIRAEQIGRGTPALVEKLAGDEAITTAEREFAAGRIPFVIRRYLPDGSFEDWKLSELGACDRRLSHTLGTE